MLLTIIATINCNELLPSITKYYYYYYCYYY